MSMACAQLPLAPPHSLLCSPLLLPTPKDSEGQSSLAAPAGFDRRPPRSPDGPAALQRRLPRTHDREAGTACGTGVVGDSQRVRVRHRPPDERDPHGPRPAPTARLAPAFRSRRVSHQPDGPARLLRARVRERSRLLEADRALLSLAPGPLVVGRREHPLGLTRDLRLRLQSANGCRARLTARNILSREWREVGLGAAHFAAAPGQYRGGPVTIVTADFGART